MDGLSALSVAASIAQFIEFTCSLVTRSMEIYTSAQGAPLQQVEMESAIKRLIELSERIKAAPLQDGGLAIQNQTLTSICQGCITMSNQLLVKLNKLKIEDGQKHRGYKSFRQALKSVWAKRSIDEMAARLNAFRKELDAHVLVSLSEKFNSLSLLQDERFTNLDGTLQQVIEPLLHELVSIHSKVDRAIILNAEHLALESIYEDKKTNSILLNRLQFSTMTHRCAEIAEAHQKTFSWLLNEEPVHEEITPTRPWNSFVQWLRSDGEIYWINGKAGSGKSTLMRYICSKDETWEHLQYWSRDSAMQMPSFYFWNSGDPLQRSQSGLLRGLLYEILDCREDLIRFVFASEWDSIRAAIRSGMRPKCNFTRKRLEEAFITLSDLSCPDFKICFFVDGLDEYEGDPELLINLFTTISKSPYIKICLSSRPWLIFEEAFESCPGLRLQDLTRDDIVQYVHDKLQTNEQMKRLKQSDPAGANLLVRTITDKANGVFLWVAIVTKSFVAGLRNHDSVSFLQQRLEKLPSDLNALYTHMINRIDPLYIDEASRMFRIFDSAMDVGFQPSILEFDLALTADYSSVKAPATEMTLDEIEHRCDRIIPQLSSRCEGLLEVHDNQDRHWEDQYMDFDSDEMVYKTGTSKSSSPDPCLENQVKFNRKVAYLHRTVKDFLKTNPIRAKFERSSSLVAQFNPEFSLLLSFVINLKRSLRTLNFYAASPVDMVRQAMITALKWAERGAAQSHECPEAFAEFLDQAYKWRTDPAIFPSTPPSCAEWWGESISLAVRFGARHCVQYLIENNERSPDSTSLLLYALGLARNSKNIHHYPIFAKCSHQVNRKMVCLLLEHGADPYELWQPFLDEIKSGALGRDNDSELIECSHIIQDFLRYKPQRTAGTSSIYQPLHNSLSLRSLINDVFSKRLPKEAIVLRRACDLARSRKRESRNDKSIVSTKRLRRC